MAKPTKPAGGFKPETSLVVDQSKDETGAQSLARKVLEPHFRHALTASAFASSALGNNIEKPGIMDFIRHVEKETENAHAGDLAMVSQMLAADAITLDSMFTEFARRAAVNMGEYLEASERYARLALKAQANKRATLETLVRLHQPREQIVRHVHVNEGGQAVVADHFHNHAGGYENAKSDKQSDATGAAGQSAALPSADTSGNGVPITSRKGKAPL